MPITPNQYVLLLEIEWPIFYQSYRLNKTIQRKREYFSCGFGFDNEESKAGIYVVTGQGQRIQGNTINKNLLIE